MSKQDSHFFNVFSLVIGLLVATALVLIAVARAVQGDTQGAHVADDPQYVRGVAARIAPPVQVAVAGQDNSALAVAQTPAPAAGTAQGAAAPQAAAAPAAGASAAGGADVFAAACSACHGQGIAGAPKAGDAAAWKPRIAKGKALLYQHALQGFTGQAGVMPPKGGRVDLSDDAVKAAVDHMVQMSQ